MNNSEKFKKYSSIENHYQENFLTKCPQEKIAWCITEKIHGANFQVYYDGEQILLGSRNRFIKDNENFNNLNNLIQEIKPQLLHFFKSVNPESLPITLYGEVYGDGIQKGVKYSKTKKIRFFDLKFKDEYIPYDLALELFEFHRLPHIPVLECFNGTISEVIKQVNTRFNSTIAEGDYSELENNLCEGVVIKPYYKEYKTILGNRVIIKKKNEEFLEKKQRTKEPKPDRFNDYSKDLEVTKPYINENRFDSVFSKDNYTKTDFGAFITAYAKDVLEDAAKDSVEILNIKNLNNIVAKETKEEYFRRVA